MPVSVPHYVMRVKRRWESPNLGAARDSNFYKRRIQCRSASRTCPQRVGGPHAEARAFQAIATLAGGMMLARAYQDTTAFDHAAAGLYRDSEVPAEMSRRKLREAR